MNMRERKFVIYRKGMIGILISVVLLSGCGKKQVYVPELLESADATVEWQKVMRGEFSDSFVAGGYVQPLVRKYSFGVAGNLGTLKVSIGEEVKASDVLAELDVKETFERQQDLEEQIAYEEINNTFTIKQLENEKKREQLELEKLIIEKKNKEIEIKKIQIRKTEANLEYEKLRGANSILRMQEQIQQIKADRERKDLIADSDGTVISLNNLKVGDKVESATVVVMVADNSQVRIATTENSEAQYKFADRIETILNGKRTELTYVPYSKTELTVAKMKNYILPSCFQIKADTTKLECGTYLPIIVHKKYVADTLFIPQSALYKDGETYYVYLNQQESKKYTEVTIGQMTNARVEILAGLKEGDEVYVR